MISLLLSAEAKTKTLQVHKEIHLRVKRLYQEVWFHARVCSSLNCDSTPPAGSDTYNDLQRGSRKKTWYEFRTIKLITHPEESFSPDWMFIDIKPVSLLTAVGRWDTLQREHFVIKNSSSGSSVFSLLTEKQSTGIFVLNGFKLGGLNVLWIHLSWKRFAIICRGSTFTHFIATDFELLSTSGKPLNPNNFG